MNDTGPVDPAQPETRWEGEEALRQTLDRQRRMSRVGVLMPLVVTVAIVGSSLYVTWSARSAANANGEALSAVEEVAKAQPGVVGPATQSPAEVIRALSDALEAKTTPQPPPSPPPDQACLPAAVTNPCDFTLGPSDVVAFYPTDSIELSPTDTAVLRNTLRCMPESRTGHVVVEGYADQRQSDRNQWLAEQRAQVAAAVVRSQLGSSITSVDARGRGANFPASLRASSPLECQRVAIIKFMQP